MNEDRSQEQLEPSNQVQASPTREGPADESTRQEPEDSNPDVVYDEGEEDDNEELGNFHRNSVGRQSIRSNSGRNINIARQNNFRMSIRSESGISHGVHHDESDGERGLSRQRPGSMNTRRGMDVGVRRGGTDPAFSLPINNNLTNREDFQNSDSGMLPLSIHQIQTPKQEAAANILPTNPFTSPLSDVPGFKDPEILGDSTDSLERLKINLPPDIYSSQILRTVRSPAPRTPEHDSAPEGEACADEELDNEFFESGPMILTEIKKSTQSLDRFISLEPSGKRQGRF